MKHRLTTIILFVFFFLLLVQSVMADNLVEISYYYSGSCGSCRHYSEEVIKPLESFNVYKGKIAVIWKDVSKPANRKEMQSHNLSFPSVVINNETRVPKSDLNFTNLVTIIDAYLAEQNVIDTYDERIVDIPVIGEINVSGISMPVLTIIIAGADSLNVCSIFILFVLLSLLVNAESRKRMILVGGIFIFFSFLWYLLFMFILQRILSSFEMIIIASVVGAIAVFLGLINIKDFFLFKKGVSTGIPEGKKQDIFRRMRELVKSPYRSVVIISTITLAVTVNLFEFVCSLALPAIYVGQLQIRNLLSFEQYLYIISYNVIYVIPLIIIFLLFVVTLGRRKISEFQGRVLKLFSGIFILSFGIIFLYDYMIFHMISTPIIILILSIVLTVIIASIWKQYYAGNDTE